MARMNYIGIDNGLEGGIVRVDSVGRLVSKQVTPTEQRVAGKTKRAVKKNGVPTGESKTVDIIRHVYDLRAIREVALALGREHAAWSRGEPGKFKLLVALEKSQPLPPRMRGGQGDFSTGYGFGIWCAMLSAFNVPYILVPAVAWQKKMLAGVAGTDSKQRSIAKARQIHPTVDWRATEKSKKPHSGLTDAFWLAEFARLYGTGS